MQTDYLTDLRAKRAGTWGSMKQIIETAKAAQRGLTSDEDATYQRLDDELNTLTAELDLAERDAGHAAKMADARGQRNGLETIGGAAARFGRPLDANARFADLPGHAPDGDSFADFGQHLRAVATGEHRANPLTEGTDSEGGFAVPTPLASYVLDLARSQMVTAKAGAQVIPMESKTLRIPKLTKDADFVFRNEEAAITEDDIAFGAVTFTARSAAVLIKSSMELLEDAPVVGQTVASTLAKKAALLVDRTVLRGTGVAPIPAGILTSAGVTVTDFAAAPITYDALIAQVAALKGVDYPPTGIIYAPRSGADLGKAKATDNQYIHPPSYLDGVSRYETSSVPINLLAGTNKSEVYFGDFREVAVGMRTAMKIIPLREKYADTGQVGWIGWLRFDVQVLRSAAFRVLTNVAAAP